MVFFFFKQKTAYEIYQCDWSSDVCSSDLVSLCTKLVSEVDCLWLRTRTKKRLLQSRQR